MSRPVLSNLGLILQIAGMLMILPILLGFFFDETGALISYFVTTLVFFGAGFLLNAFSKREDMDIKSSAILIVSVFFLLGLVEATGFGLIVTSLLGPFMVVRNWSDAGVEISLEALRANAHPFLGELPMILGAEPLLLFPTAVVLMSFLAFFIGTFLQLLWEDLPITEPL